MAKVREMNEAARFAIQQAQISLDENVTMRETRIGKIVEHAGGQVMEGAGDERSRRSLLDGERDRAARRDESLQLVSHLGKRVDHRHDDLPLEV